MNLDDLVSKRLHYAKIPADVKDATDDLTRATAEVRGGSHESHATFDFSSALRLVRFTTEMDKINTNLDRYLE
jgi:hypothetical protein